MSNQPQININGVDIQWDTEKGTFTFFGIPSALFWINPSLLTMLKPLADEVGYDLFRLQVAASASQGTDEDYNNMVTVLGNTFEEGFLKWGAAVSSAGWGTFELLAFDPQNKTAKVRVSNTWELVMQKDFPDNWGCPFIQGKIIGIFKHALNINCWADESKINFEPNNMYVEFDIYQSDRTITQEIENSRLNRMQETEKALSLEVNKKTLALNAATLKAEAASYAKSKFMASISHELRTPLNAVIGMSQRLDRNKDNNLTDTQKKQVAYILEAGSNMLALINQVLAFSEVSIDSQEVVTEEITIQIIIQHCIDLTMPIAQRRNISISNETMHTSPYVVVGNTEYVKEILLILLSNASNYIPENGEVEITCTAKQDNFARISVIDNGPGISKEKQEHIFEPFERLDDSGEISGAGVGLPIAKLMVGVMGGSMGYENNDPTGAIFWIDLPLKV